MTRTARFLAAACIVGSSTSACSTTDDAGISPASEEGDRAVAQSVPEIAEPNDFLSMVEGTFEYVDGLAGMAMARDGRYIYFLGPSDGSVPPTATAGAYEINGDTITNTIMYATDPSRVGAQIVWTPVGMSGDTLTIEVLEGLLVGRSRAVRVN